MLKVLALTVRPSLAADVRYRILQYLPYFRDIGIEVHPHSLYSEGMYRRHQSGREAVGKTLLYLYFYWRRLTEILTKTRDYEAVWIGRELAPIGPPVLERLLFHFKKRVILDIDDAIFIPDDTTRSFVHHRLRDFEKYRKTAYGYDTVVCGNSFLAAYFRNFHPRVHVIPTVVSAEQYGAISKAPSPLVRIGWIGTPESSPHLELLREPFDRLLHHRNVKILIVGLTQPLPGLDDVGIHYLPWTLAQELEYFRHFDIGVMPLIDSAFVKGKCAFKLVQYMAAGIPVVASPVGANLDVVKEGDNGFFADGAAAWSEKLELLVGDPSLRRDLGQNGRKTVCHDYSLEKWWKPYARLFGKALDP
jgi:glycosyltransferase involved in cell wall biosynthesis